MYPPSSVHKIYRAYCSLWLLSSARLSMPVLVRSHVIPSLSGRYGVHLSTAVLRAGNGEGGAGDDGQGHDLPDRA